MNRLILVDGNAILHRAYHALPPLTTVDGLLVNAVYGFVSMLLKIFHDFQPTHIAVAFDRPAPTFRKSLYAPYQATRPKMEDDLSTQVKLVHDVVSAFGIPIFELDGFEADDVLGTIAQQAMSKKEKVGVDQVVIVTGDRDLLQLVDDNKVLVFMPTKGLSEGKVYTEKDVVTRMGVVPKLVPDLKALAGDASDNYPGVAGIGPKTAVPLLTQFGSLTRVLDLLDTSAPTELSERVWQQLRTGREQALLARELATIRHDVPIELDLSAARVETLDTSRARAALEVFGFKSLVQRLGAQGKESKVKRVKSGVLQEGPRRQLQRAKDKTKKKDSVSDQLTLV